MESRDHVDSQELQHRLKRTRNKLVELQREMADFARRQHDVEAELTAGIDTLASRNQQLEEKTRALEQQLAVAVQENSKLQGKLKEADEERTCLTTRHHEEVEKLEIRMNELEQQQPPEGPQQPGLHRSQPPEGPQQPAAQSSFPFFNAVRGVLGMGPTGNGYNGPSPAGPLPARTVSAEVQANGNTWAPGLPVAPAAAPPIMRLPPVLPLDPAHLLPEADLAVGFTRSDIGHQVHEFSSALSFLTSHDHILRVASGFIDSAERTAIPGGAVNTTPPDGLSAARPAFLGHLLLYWLKDSVWADPLRFLGCNLTLGNLPVLDEPDRNLLALLRSHAARQWLPAVRSVTQAITAAEHSDNPDSWRALLNRQDASTTPIAVGAAANEMAGALANWLRNFPTIAAAVKVDTAFHSLLLRALHLGLMVLAAHPLLRLQVATPQTEIPAQQPRQLPLEPNSQDSRRRILFGGGSPGHAKHAGGGSFVLCSVQPGVRFDSRLVADTAAGAAAVEDASSLVVVKEEVVTWEWARPAQVGSQREGSQRRRSFGSGPPLAGSGK